MERLTHMLTQVDNVPLSQSVGDLTALTQGLSVYAQFPLSIIHLPSPI
jgi:hypothetical protein